jgi:hypothetical protein
MNGHVFQCFNETNISNQFAKTVEVLAEYIAKHIKYPGDMASLTDDLTLPTLTAPVILPITADELEKLLWKQDMVQYAQRRAYLVSNHKAIYAVIWGQCSEALRAKIKSHHEYIAKKAESECGWLLKEIKGVMMRFESKSKPMWSLNAAVLKLYAYRQGPNTPMQVFRDEFSTSWSTTAELLRHIQNCLKRPWGEPTKRSDGRFTTSGSQFCSFRPQTLGVLGRYTPI